MPVNKITQHVNFGLWNIARKFNTGNDGQSRAPRRFYCRIDSITRIMIGQREDRHVPFNRKPNQVGGRQLAIRRGRMRVKVDAPRNRIRHMGWSSKSFQSSRKSHALEDFIH